MTSNTQDTPPATSTKRTSRLAIASLVLGLLGCTVLPAPFAILLGALALWKMKTDTTLGGRKLALAGIVLGVVGLVIGAIAYDGFWNFARRRFAAEARQNLDILWTGVLNYAIAPATDPSQGVGTLHLRGMPPSLPPAPTGAPSGIRQNWVTVPGSMWEQLHFRPGYKTLFVYSIVADPARNLLILRAEGDQDTDGVRSTFEIRAHITPSGLIEREPGIHVENETE